MMTVKNDTVQPCNMEQGNKATRPAGRPVIPASLVQRDRELPKKDYPKW
jgi:hypothetical protein